MRNIIIVDSDLTQAEILEGLLSENNFAIKKSADALSALKYLNEEIPDLILMDLELSDRDGLELLKEIRRIEKFTEIIIIILSAKTDNESIVGSLKSGANEFIRKPFNNEELLIRMSRLLELKDRKEETLKLNMELKNDREKIQQERNLLVKYLSRDVVDAILHGGIPSDIGGKVLEATLMFCDLRNSTAMAESVAPNLFSKFISNLFTDISDLIIGQGGSINKFLGDGILATFGCPVPQEDQKIRALLTAINIRKYIKNFNSFRPKYLIEPIMMGIGIAYGKVFAGNIGSINRMEYSVVGDAVNVASRLQVLTKKANVDILIDENIREVMGAKLKAKKVRGVALRGKKNKIGIFYPEYIKN